MKNFRLTVIAVLLAFSASQAAFAQAPGTTGATTEANAAGAADNGTVTNATTTTTTTTTTGGIAPDTDLALAPVEGDGEVAAATNLTDTGGAPLMMVASGLAIALSAFALRRKVSA
jgi:hypothetical protein